MDFSSFTLFSNFNIHKNHLEYLLKVQVPEPHLETSDAVDEGRAQESAFDGGTLNATSLCPKGLGSEHF